MSAALSILCLTTASVVWIYIYHIPTSLTKLRVKLKDNMSSFLIKDVRLFTGEEVLENGFVLVEDGTISAVGRAIDIPDGLDRQQIKTISKPNHTLLPGFIDAHIHADKGKELALYQSLRFGVTTVMDMHNEPHNVAALKKLASKDKDCADFKSAGVAATIDNGWPAPVVTAHDKSPEVRSSLAPTHACIYLIPSPLSFACISDLVYDTGH